MSAGFAKKIGMTRLFIGDKSVAVTALEFQPGYVLQLKPGLGENKSKLSVQIGAIKQRKVSKAELGHIKKTLPEVEHGFRLVAEFGEINLEDDKKTVEISDFASDDKLDITGVTIGKGTTGVVKRWGFAGQPKSHGHDHERAVGSMGSRWPQRVTKGKKMAGRHGNTNLTLKKVKIVAIDTENNLLFVNGSVPGANSSFLKIKKVS
jgi:large subunit ribosomal protein L3